LWFFKIDMTPENVNGPDVFTLKPVGRSLVVLTRMKIFNNVFTVFLVLFFSVVYLHAQETEAGAGSPVESGKLVRDLNSLKPGDDNPDNFITAASYVFTAQSGIGLEDMSSGTTQLIAPGSDNNNSALGQIGFVTRFDGGYYTSFGVNANGLIKLGDVTTTTNTINSIDSVTNSPKIAPYWDDLCVGSAGKVHYKTVGSPGTLKLVIEWSNMKITRGNVACDGSGGGTFQMWLFERTGVVQFVYGNGMVVPAAANSGYSIGIQFDAAANFASITASSNSVSYVAANNAQATAITAGTSFLLSPNIPAAPINGSAAPVTQTSATVNWTDVASDETGYLVRRTTDNFNFFFVGYLGSNANTFTDTGLTPSTQYFYYVNALSPGAFSGDLVIPATTNASLVISSTAAGGPWSAPSTWVGGVIPGTSDNVTIVSGATVSIDTSAVAGNVTIGSVGGLAQLKGALTEGVRPEGGAPARLTFEETAGHTLTVANDVTIGSNDVFATGNGNANAHVLTIGGNLTNHGTLDFSTNNNQAGAMIVFNGASNNTFGGTGATTDVMWISINKASPSAILELSVPNFTVQGSTTDTPGSGYLFLGQGIFKISGTFTGTHRTFPVAAYDIPVTGGFWLNNPNYTVAAQSSSAQLHGAFRLTAGTYNAGTAAGHNFTINGSPSILIEGGKINVTGAFGTDALTTTISGGTVTACTIGPVFNCFIVLSPQLASNAVILSGGDLVLQNAGTFLYDAPVSEIVNLRGTTLHFGNALSNGASAFNMSGLMPNAVIDTTAGAHSLTSNSSITHVNNLNIGPGGIFQFPSLFIHGTTIVNNGQLKVTSGIGVLDIDDLSGLTDVTFGGTGTMNGFLGSMRVRSNSLTFGPALGNLVTYNLKVTKAHLTNAARISLGRNDSTLSTVEVYDGATFDVAPDFNLGPNGERVIYNSFATTGPEIHPDRVLNTLQYTGPGSLTIAGGDIVATTLLISSGVVFTGPFKITTQIQPSAGTGYVDGNLRMQFAPGHVGSSFEFKVGQNGLTSVTVALMSVTGPSALTIRAVDATLPGLIPATSASRYWTITEEGDITARLTFKYIDADVRGNESNYKLWVRNGGTPIMVLSTANAALNQVVSFSDIGILTGDWGIGEQLDPGPVSIGGSVTTSGGQPIANALLTISGGNLPAPIHAQTGSFGLYQFSNLQAGETYTVRVDVKRFRFSVNTQQVTPLGNVSNVNFVANPQE
jgi:hypothetical protein